MLIHLPFVEIEKVASTDAPKYLPADSTLGVTSAGFSLAVGYVIRGWLITPFALNESVIVLRLIRNGIVAQGIFHTTPIITFDDKRFSTVNSIYCWRLISAPIPKLGSK